MLGVWGWFGFVTMGEELGKPKSFAQCKSNTPTTLTVPLPYREEQREKDSAQECVLVGPDYNDRL